MPIFRRLAHQAAAAARVSRLPDTEAPLTSTRPLGGREHAQVLSRQAGGWSDIYSIVGLDTTPGSRSITEEDVLHAWAAVRLRHPTLASRVSFANPHPEFVCSSPVSEAHAVQEAKAVIRFGTFEDRDAEVASLLERYRSIDPSHVLDIRSSTAALQWSTGVGAAEGQYVFGMQSSHCNADGFGLLNVLRHVLELLSQQGEAQAELVGRFSSPAVPLQLPICTDDLIPHASSYTPAELEAGRRVYAEMMKASVLAKSGLVPDGTHNPEKAAFRVINKVWSPSETVQILRSCRARGVTITQLSTAAMALASVDTTSVSYEQPASLPPQSPGQPYAFAINSVVDLSRRLFPSTETYDMETSTRTGVFPIILQTMRSLSSAQERTAALWEMAAECRSQTAAFLTSPHFWQLLGHARTSMIQSYFDGLAGKPVLPIMSSLGDCAQVLPPRYAITPSGRISGSPDGRRRRGDELSVASLAIGGKLFPSLHLWTYHDRLRLQLTYDSSQYGDALMGPYFRRTADLISQAGE